MRWDRFFEDLEDQLDSEWEAERAALDTEAERLRLSRVVLRERLVALSRQPREVAAHLADGTTVIGRIARVGADWFAAVSTPAGGPLGAQAVIVPLSALTGIGAPMDAVLVSVREADPGPALAQRMGLGFVLRDLVRRRVAVTVQTSDGRELAGTIDRAGADHLDLAVHDRGAPRRAENVTGYRVVPFAAIVLVRLAEASDLD
ncbi:MAG: hypothetical protein J0I43_14120 [Microbacterium sp.]|uniref:hypothetical protein n=1 Tax=Microbacterium sp. TaxID=51671 RepID=UPI001ACC7D7F|nr:hypothetical protein [Microbacterium sp.]MBN9178484.1 hypothetical protein [Microbacterium sp.]